ncbi:MAG: DUF4160 domain-containing protein [Bacteroidota bacterium]
MPVILRLKGYKFLFFSNEGDEPVHIHIQKAGGNAKMWLDPLIEDEYFYGFNNREIKEIKAIVNEHRENFKRAWYEYFGQ